MLSYRQCGEKVRERMKKKYEIWATYQNGMKFLVEIHKTEESAKYAIDALNHHNQYEISIGYGFPYGLPTYIIR